MAAKILFPILLIISIALFLSAAEAQYSSISATPAAAPGPAPEASVSIDALEDVSLAVKPTESYDPSLAAEPSEAPSGDSNAAAKPSKHASQTVDLPKLPPVSPWRKSDINLLDVPIMSYDVPADKRSSVNKFVQSTMQVTESKTENFIAVVIDKRLEEPQIGTFTKDCLKTCKDVYEDAKDAMKKTLEDISKGDYYKANIDVGAISSDSETCKECVKMVYGKDQELDRFNMWVDGVIDKCLTMITGYKTT